MSENFRNLLKNLKYGLEQVEIIVDPIKPYLNKAGQYINYSYKNIQDLYNNPQVQETLESIDKTKTELYEYIKLKYEEYGDDFNHVFSAEKTENLEEEVVVPLENQLHQTIDQQYAGETPANEEL